MQSSDLVTLTAADLLVCEPFEADANTHFLHATTQNSIAVLWVRIGHTYVFKLNADRTTYVRACLNRYRDALAPWAISARPEEQGVGLYSSYLYNPKVRHYTTMICPPALRTAMAGHVWEIVDGTWTERT